MDEQQYRQQLNRNGFCVLTITSSDMTLGQVPGKFTVIGLCTRGEATLEINMEQCRFTSGSRICYTHVMTSRTLAVSDDFGATLLVMTDKFAFDSMVGISTDIVQALFTAPVQPVTDPLLHQFLTHLTDCLHLYAHIAVSQPHAEVPQSLLRNMLVMMGESELHNRHETTRSVYSMADTYFRNFINLIYDQVHREHEVAYYASQLHITSKYLNEICKSKSGHKAKEIISMVLLGFIKRDLTYTGKSMKELAADYHFADQSSLGKFFRKLTGRSPLAFKHETLP